MDSEYTNSFFLKLDTESDAKLIHDLYYEKMELLSSIFPLETASIDGTLLKSFKSILHIPTYQDLLKINIEQAKSLSKLLNINKNNLNNIMNKLLSIDFKHQFIFCQKNLDIICNILIYAFGEKKKIKISTYDEFESKVKSLDFSKYDFIKTHLKKETLEKKNSNLRIHREQKLNAGLLSNMTIKEINDDWTEIDNDKINFENKYYSKKRGFSYIDNNYKNFVFSSLLYPEYNYNEEQLYIKLVNSRNFDFTKTNKDDTDLPIELIILLYKLKDVKTLILQINDANDKFVKMALFVLMNINWLFISQIEEIKIDLNDVELHKKLYNEFNKRASELYEDHRLTKPLYYFPGHNSRKYNFWEPEGDLIFEKVALNSNNVNNNNIIFSQQNDLIDNTFDNTLCNIYNENGFITNFKYIRPIIYTINDLNNDNDFIKTQGISDNFDNLPFSNYHTNSLNLMKLDKKPSIGNMFGSIKEKNINLSLLSKDKIENQSEKTTTEIIKDFVKNNVSTFHLISLYCFFLQSLQNLKKFCLYFDFSFSYEMQILFSLYNSVYERFHFLIFANSINSLTEANFSFNSLDSIAFENILGVIKKNKNLTKLKMSLFSQEIIYSENNLFHLCSQQKNSLNKIFTKQKELLIKTNADMERSLVYFIIHHNKILDNFEKNLRNLFNLLEFESLNTLIELVLRFDIPSPILNSEKYINLLIKFIVNILIALSLQKNQIKIFKILAPKLPMDANRLQLIKQFFEELGELKNNNEKNEDKDDKNRISPNATLEEITLNIKFYNIPEIFNIIYINNLPNLKKINLGILDEITFISFITEYKANSENFKNLISLKISLCDSLFSYTSLSSYIKEYINTDTPKLDEKYLFTNLKIKTEAEMKEIFGIVYHLAKTPKLVLQIANDEINKKLLMEANKKLAENRDEMYSLRLIMEFPKYNKIMTTNIINCLLDFYVKKKENRMIICKENPDKIYK